MAVLTTIEQMALELPSLADPVVKNGISVALADYLQNALDTAGSLELALAAIFRHLASEDRTESERLADYSYQQRTGHSFLDRSRYWEGQAVVRNLALTQAAPSVYGGGGLPTYPALAGSIW